MADPDYQTLIDRETWDFIARTDECYPPDTASRTIAEQRAIYDAMCRSFHRGYPPGISAQDKTIAAVPCRIFAGAAPTVVYFHGGGFVVGGLESHDDICAEICQATGLSVIAADYRLCPEHLHPAAFLDCLAVVNATPGPLILVGDSAGGNLAAAVAHHLRDPRILGQVLVYPGLGGDRSTGSYVTHANAPMLTAADVAFYAHLRHGGTEPQGDATSAPLQDRDFTGLPATLAITGECDPLCDDATAYATRLRAAGGKAKSITEPGLVHGYLRARKSVPRAGQSFARITETIAAFARNEWPFQD